MLPIVDYDIPARHSRSPRRTVRIVALILLTTATAVSVYHWRGAIASIPGRVARERDERACLNYQPPPSQVIYDDNPTTCIALRAQPGYSPAPSNFPKPAAVADNPILSAYLKSHPEPYISTTTGEPVLFMHGLTAPGGGQRLVVVTLSPTTKPTLLYFSASGTPSGDNFHSPSGCLNLVLRPDDRLRLFAGSSDPNDPSHFTIPYTLNGAAGVLDGYLTASYTVAITPRSSATTRGTYQTPVWAPSSAPIPDLLRSDTDTLQP